MPEKKTKWNLKGWQDNTVKEKFCIKKNYPSPNAGWNKDSFKLKKKKVDKEIFSKGRPALSKREGVLQTEWCGLKRRLTDLQDDEEQLKW